MDHIVQSGYTPTNIVRRSHPCRYHNNVQSIDALSFASHMQYVNALSRSHIFFLAAFDDNGSFLSQLNLLVMLCESFIQSLTIYMPYYPVGTMERTLKEGEGCAPVISVLFFLPLNGV